MSSPFVRRRRLAAELRALREQRGMTADDLARAIYRSRMTVSKLENARCRPDLGDISNILGALGVEDDEWQRIFAIARGAARRGWWDAYGDAMGDRQRMYADVESGAATIRGYNQFGFPGILQTPDFIRALIKLDEAAGPLDYDPVRVLEARLKRQETALGAGGPAFDIVLDEFVMRRLAVDANVMSTQLTHLVSLVSAEPRLSVYVLPVDARVKGGFLARSSFLIYTFPDQDDPPMVIADTAGADVVHTEADHVTRYVEMFERLRAASLSTVSSLTLLDEAARRLGDLRGS